MGMYGERLGRGVTREAARKYETSVTERAVWNALEGVDLHKEEAGR